MIGTATAPTAGPCLYPSIIVTSETGANSMVDLNKLNFKWYNSFPQAPTTLFTSVNQITKADLIANTYTITQTTDEYENRFFTYPSFAPIPTDKNYAPFKNLDTFFSVTCNAGAGDCSLPLVVGAMLSKTKNSFVLANMQTTELMAFHAASQTFNSF